MINIKVRKGSTVGDLFTELNRFDGSISPANFEARELSQFSDVEQTAFGLNGRMYSLEASENNWFQNMQALNLDMPISLLRT